MGFMDFVTDWAKVLGMVMAFLAIPAAILGVLAAFGFEFSVALVWTAYVAGIIYAVSGLILGHIYSVRTLVRKELKVFMNESKRGGKK